VLSVRMQILDMVLFKAGSRASGTGCHSIEMMN
jgi:hypothetical protein